MLDGDSNVLDYDNDVDQAGSVTLLYKNSIAAGAEGVVIPQIQGDGGSVTYTMFLRYTRSKS